MTNPSFPSKNQIDPASVPVLLLAWQRPHTLSRVLDALREVRPRKLFIACDGPNPLRTGNEEKVNDTRKVIENGVDWPCEVHRLYSPVNLGCSAGPIQAMNWFFSHNEEGIILEDDCVPHPDFFSFCAELLHHYRDDTRIWCISGNNFQDGIWRGDGSYYYSRYTHNWGWATWRRSWIHYDSRLQAWPFFRDSGYLDCEFDDPIEKCYWKIIWEKTYGSSDSVSWWDYQWLFASVINSALTILPNKNLVSNIGYGPDSSHHQDIPSQSQKAEPLGNLIHPSLMVRHALADKYTFKSSFLGLRNKPMLYTIQKFKSYAREYFIRNSG